MAKLTINLDMRGKSPQKSIRLRLAHRNESVFVNTKISILPEYFTGDVYSPVSKSAPNARISNERISAMARKIEEAMYEFERDNELDNATAAEIIDRALALKRTPMQVRRQLNKQSFLVFFREYAGKRASDNTVRSYYYADKVLTEFWQSTHDTQEPTFSDITYSMLSDFETYMKNTGKGDRARYMIFSYIRSAFKEALRRDLFMGKNPFDIFKIKRPQQKEEIDYISHEAMRKFLSLDLRHLQGVNGLSRARDIAVISLCLCGANMIDIYEMPPMEGEIVFKRSKMSGVEIRPMHIKIQPILQELIDKYKGKDHLFCFAEHGGDYLSFRRKQNERLSRLSKYVGEKITMASIRATWATYAGELDIPDRVIDKSMGHKDSGILHSHYQHYDWSKTDSANERVLEVVYDGVIPNSIHCPAYV